ncbi:MAG: response regulator, partial [Thermodesulfovibrionales bacterium]|nr:response regulator [Thermodesulfovibrionales bacterium]
MMRKMLLADDSITIQKVVELVLAEEGFEIKAVNNGEEALAAIETFKPDVVLADIVMPKMNGYQLCDKIKANPATRNVPVILLSGAFEPLDEELARNVKADSFVIKPFESQELISKINAALVSASTMEETAEAVEAVEAEVFAEAVGAEEDLWAMEAVEGVSVETPAGIEEVSAEEEVSIAQALETAEQEAVEFEVAEEAEVEAEEMAVEDIAVPVMEASEKESMARAVPPMFKEQVIPVPVETPVRKEMPGVQIPSKEELIPIFKKAVDERVASALSAIDIKGVMLES